MIEIGENLFFLGFWGILGVTVCVLAWRGNR
jgi:hypothetical protein